MLLALWRWVEIAMQGLLVFGITVMTTACFTQVIARYFFHNPLNWTEELARFVFVWVSYLAAWLAWKYRAHIAIDAVYYIDRRWLHNASRLLVEGLVLALCLYTFWTNLSLIRLAINQPSPILQVPMGWVYAGYSAMVTLIALDILMGWITGRRSKTLDIVEA